MEIISRTRCIVAEWKHGDRRGQVIIDEMLPTLYGVKTDELIIMEAFKQIEILENRNTR